MHPTLLSLDCAPSRRWPQPCALFQRALTAAAAAALFFCGFGAPRTAAAPAHGWFNWRGPEQNGVSRETGLPEKIGSKDEALWTAPFPGQSTPVIANGRLYIMGYRDDGPDLQEGLACFDAETGARLWERRYNDFLSDTIYLRYSTSTPAIDPETGGVFMHGTQGILAAFTADGAPIWSHSLMEKFGRMTFPNSRTASPLLDHDLVITHAITSNWGDQGSPADRFYAFDKKTGEIVWASATGVRPMDNSFSHPYLAWYLGRRVFYCATGDGAVVCINARTGETLWRAPFAKAGINATLLVHNNDKIIAIYGTPYEPGQMVALKIPASLPPRVPPPNLPLVERAQIELWANDLSTSTSSPILVGDRIYVVAEKGDFCAVDANTGRIAWRLTLGIEQRNACPLFADGRLYVPILDDPQTKEKGSGETGSKGGFYIIKPGDTAGEITSHVELDGRCFGTPVAFNGKVYIQTNQKLYCFGKKGNNPGLKPAPLAEAWPKAGPAAQLQIVPREVLLHPGEKASFRARVLDANGFLVENVADTKSLQWTSYIPPTALVRATMQGQFDNDGKLMVPADARSSAGAFEATLGNVKGYIRGRVLSGLPIREDFESFELSNTTTNTAEPPTKFAYPPLPWIGARFRFEVRDVDGTRALTKTIDNKLLQRATSFFGSPAMSNYTIQADVRSEGARRKMSEVGVVNQRYIIVLKGNAQQIEVNSNLERLKVSVPFAWSPNAWYTIKARVDLDAKGEGVVRGKAWKKGEPEPAAWTIEVPHKTAHTQGSPGLFALSPQEMRVFIDNIAVTSN